MNLKNLMMWGLLVLLVVGLYQLFQTSDQPVSSNKIAFSNFLQQVEDGRVVKVEIIGNNIRTRLVSSKPISHIKACN